MHIIVAGGGPAGCAAAIAAARLGAEVTLVERYGFLGGMATAGLVHPWMKYHAGSKPVVGGIFAEIVTALKSLGGFKDSRHYDIPHHCFDPELLKWVLQQLLLRAGVRFSLHTQIIGVITENQGFKCLKVASKSGIEYLYGDTVVDATGDADVAFGAGAPYALGDSSGLTQPLTLHFRMAGVDERAMPSREEINQLYSKAKAARRISIPREDLLWFDTVREGEIHFNSTRLINFNGLVREDLTAAELEARKQVMELVAWIKTSIPGFEKAYLSLTAAQTGVRESRRITGEYVLTREDIISGRKFADQIALSSYGIDIHNPKGEGTEFAPLDPGIYYGIPYGCLVPKQVEGIIVGGRPISTTHEAFSAIRIQPVCYATGQAAGVAAVLSLKTRRPLRALDATRIQETLKTQNAILE